MKKFLIVVLMFISLSCATTEKTINAPSDSTATTQQISEEDQVGYIAAVAIAGFIVVSLMILSGIIPPYGP